jgi:hypothetical protein
LLQQVPEQQLLFAAQEVPAAEQTQVLVVESQMFEQQSLLLVHPISLLAIQATQVDVVASQTRPEQQSLWDKQPWPLVTHGTHVMLVVSHLCEQQSASLVQEPAFAIQQVPLLQVWAAEHVETQVPLVESHFRHWLVAHGADRQWEPQTFALSQHPLLRQV